MKNSILLFALLAVAPAAYASVTPSSIATATDTQESLNTRLGNAIIQKDLNQVKGLIALGASPNGDYASFEDEAVHSMIYLAIRSQDLAIVQALVEAGADVNTNTRHSSSMRPMHILAQTQNIPILQYLVQKGIDLDQRDIVKKTALMKFFMNSQAVDFARALIAAGANINAQDSYGNTALVILLDPATRGNVETRRQVLELLIQSGADLNTGKHFPNRSFTDMSTLAYAVSVENLESIKMLVEAGARAWPEESLLSIAARAGKADVVQYLVSLGASDINAAFFAAATSSKIGRSNPVEVEEFLLQQGADINFINPQTGGTALHDLASRGAGTADMWQWLLDHGANPNLQDRKKQQTPLVHLQRYWLGLGWSSYYTGSRLTKEIERITELFEILKQTPGFNINLPATQHGYTALQDAVSGASRPVYRLRLVQLLVESGADITLKTPEGRSLLSLAETSGTDRYQIINYLRSIGAN